MSSVLMVAAENGALPVMRLGEREVTGRASEVGATVAEMGHALAESGEEVTVITPAYGVFHRMPGAHQIARLRVGFADRTEAVSVYEVPGRVGRAKARNLVLDHALFAQHGPGQIYADGGEAEGGDGRRFALFSLAVAEGCLQNQFGTFDTVHLHDWPAAFMLILRRFHRTFRLLRNRRHVFSYYTRDPLVTMNFAQASESLSSWFSELAYNQATLEHPQYAGQASPTAAAIRLADGVHVASPAYAEQCVGESHPFRKEFSAARAQGRLHGVLGGLDNDEPGTTALDKWEDVLALARARVLRWTASQTLMASSHYLAHMRLSIPRPERPKVLLTAVSKIDTNSIGVLRQRGSDGKPSLYGVLDRLGARGVFMLMGIGDPRYEQFLTDASARYENFIFLNGRSAALEHTLYRVGDLFVSVAQTQAAVGGFARALLAGQPCLGLETGAFGNVVREGESGFLFQGDTPTERADQLISTLDRALALHEKHQVAWLKVQRTAQSLRFEWTATAQALRDLIYTLPVVQD